MIYFMGAFFVQSRRVSFKPHPSQNERKRALAAGDTPPLATSCHWAPPTMRRQGKIIKYHIVDISAKIVLSNSINLLYKYYI